MDAVDRALHVNLEKRVERRERGAPLAADEVAVRNQDDIALGESFLGARGCIIGDGGVGLARVVDA